MFVLCPTRFGARCPLRWTWPSRLATGTTYLGSSLTREQHLNPGGALTPRCSPDCRQLPCILCRTQPSAHTCLRSRCRSLSVSSVSSVSSASSSSSSVRSADSEDMYADLASPVSSASSRSLTPAQQKKGRGICLCNY